MTRGARPLAAIADAKGFAERMGYRWEANTHPDLGYDLHLFKPTYSFLMRARVLRHHIEPDAFYEELIPEDIAVVQNLPFPKWMPREIWLRTQHERTFRRLRILDTGIWEIGRMQPDGYVNPHAR